MFKNDVLKFIKLLLLVSTPALLTSCSYDKTELTLGSAFDITWEFNSSNNYDFDTNLVQFQNGKVILKPLDLENSGEDFQAGSHAGSHFSQNALSMQTNPETNIINLLPDHAENVEAYWRFENSWDDLSKNNYNLTVSGDSLNSSGPKVGTASSYFDGAGDEARVDITDWNATEYSLVLWVKTSNLTQPHPTGVFTNDQASGATGDSFQVTIDGVGSGQYLYHSTNGYSLPIGPISESWVHLGVTYDGATLRTYYDGILTSETTVPLSAAGLMFQNYHIGTNRNRVNDFEGNIDEIAVFRNQLESEDIYKIYFNQSSNFNELSPNWTPKWDNIVGYWKMDGNWSDSSGLNNHGTPHNNGVTDDNLPVFSTSSQVGNSSAVFDDEVALQYVEINNSPSLENFQESSFSMQVWYFPTELPNNTDNINTNHGLLVKQGNSLGLIYRPDGQFNFVLWDSSNVQRAVQSIQTFNPGKYYHIVGVLNKNNDTAYLYINGELVNTLDFSGLSVREYGVSPTRIGASSNTTASTSYGAYSDGFLDDAVIWNSALSASDVKLIYDRQKQKFSSQFESEVFDLGSTTSSWPDLSWVTTLPFNKELVGDYDNDGNPESENTASYSKLSETLNIGLVAYYAFNESQYSGLTGEIKDLSGNNHDGQISPGGATNTIPGKFNKTLPLNTRLHIPAASAPTISDSFSISIWVKGNGQNATAFWSNIAKGDGSNYLNYIKIEPTSGAMTYGINLRTNGVGNQTLRSTSDVLDGDYHHVVFTADGTNLKIFVDGVEEGSRTYAIAGGSTIDDPTANLNIGDTGSEIILDEVAIWSRDLTDDEVQQLYRRGANRVKFQVKSCIDSACNCKSYNVAPAGSETDCDGDGTPNLTDTDDIHKADFIGPGGDGTTYYSELFNRAPSDITFNCALNTTDSDPGVCVDDEISQVGNSKPTHPEFLNLDYTQFVTPAINRYAQYRVLLEADDNTACSGAPCLPELSSVSLNPNNAVKYSSEYVEIKPKNAISFISIKDAKITADDCASFRLHRGPNSYYHDGSSWVLVSDESHRNIASEVTTHIKQFASQFGAGELEVIGYLKSDITQSDQCSIESIDVNYE